MCVLFFAFRSHPVYPLVVAANRDEFYQRPTERAHFWDDYPDILGGRDLEQLGTWLGVTRQGRFAAITNFRDPTEKRDNKKSRGHIIWDYLNYGGETATFLELLRADRYLYPGFNLVLGNAKSLWYYSNIQNEIKELSSGIYGLSNHYLDTPWPKVSTGKKLFKQCLKIGPDLNSECFFRMLKRTEVPLEADLPNTGVGIEWEKTLSPIFIKSENYGTRSSAYVSFDSEHHVRFKERSFSEKKVDQVEFEFTY